jgi:hypothetical protein
LSYLWICIATWVVVFCLSLVKILWRKGLIELLLNVHCSQGCFWLVLWRIPSRNLWIERMHNYNKGCLLLVMLRLFGEMQWATFALQGLFHACLVDILGEMDWATFEYALCQGLFLVWVVENSFENCIDFFSNVQLQQGCFLLVLSSSLGEMDWTILQHVLQQGPFLACIVENSLEKGIELLWNVHCNKVFFVLMLSRLFREMGYYWMCIAKWVVSCLGYRNYSKKWIKLLLNLYCNKGCLLLVLTKEMFEIYCQAFFSCATLLLLNSSPLH